jgi:hypothetical protein
MYDVDDRLETKAMKSIPWKGSIHWEIIPNENDDQTRLWYRKWRQALRTSTQRVPADEQWNGPFSCDSGDRVWIWIRSGDLQGVCHRWIDAWDPDKNRFYRSAGWFLDVEAWSSGDLLCTGEWSSDGRSLSLDDVYLPGVSSKDRQKWLSDAWNRWIGRWQTIIPWTVKPSQDPDPSS